MFPIKFLVSSSNLFLKSFKGAHVTQSNFLKIKKYANTCNLFTSARLNDIIFVQTENIFGHEVMEKQREKYSLAKKIVFPVSSISSSEFNKLLEENWTDKKPEEVIAAFEKLSDYAYCNKYKIDSNQLDAFIDALADNMDEFNDDQLDSVCRNLMKWPQTESVAVRNYIEVWGSLDDVIMKKLTNWDIEKVLMFADNLYNLHLVRRSDFMWKALNKAIGKVMKLSPQQLVQSMFYVATYRRSMKNIFDFEIQFGRLFDNLSLDEIGVISMGFFKSKTPLRNVEIISRMIDKVTKEADTVHEITLCSILKLIRYSCRYEHVNEVIKMLDILTPRIADLSLFSCVQLALVSTKTNIVHPDSLNAISQKFIDNPALIRLKDLERLTFVLTEYKFEPQTSEPIFDFIVDELRNTKRKEEIAVHGRCLLRTLSFLAINEIYPADLINMTFDKDFLESNYGDSLKNKFKTDKGHDSVREILVMKHSVDVEFGDYKGNMVENKACQNLVNRLTDYVPTSSGKYGLNAAEKHMLEVILLLQKMRKGSDYVHGDHLLPHYQRPGKNRKIFYYSNCIFENIYKKININNTNTIICSILHLSMYIGLLSSCFADFSDVVICNDVNDKPVEVVKYFHKKNFGTVQRAPDDVNKWFAFIFVGKYASLANSRYLLGPTIMKIRQLKKIGYIPIVVII